MHILFNEIMKYSGTPSLRYIVAIHDSIRFTVMVAMDTELRGTYYTINDVICFVYFWI